MEVLNNMGYSLDQRRKNTMLERLGEAAELIDDQRYLPFYRSIQIRLEKLGKADEWQRMIDTARTKADPKRYFATLCKMVKAGTYRFVQKVKEVTGEAALYLHDKLIHFGFGKYQKYWVQKAQEFINVNGMVGFVELLEYADRKGISSKYMAAALANCKPPREYYKRHILGGAE